MWKLLTILVLTAATQASHAHADERCFVPMTEWQPREVVEDLAREKGWSVQRIRIEDGCYEVSGTDAEGKTFEATIHPSTLDLIRTELKENDDD